MKKFSIMLGTFIVASICIVISWRVYADPEKLNLPELGVQLEEQMWADMKIKNWTAVEKKIGDIFQSVHKDGSRDKAAEMALIKKLDMGGYKLSDYRVTGVGEVIVVSYMAVVDESLSGIRTHDRPTPRQSVWQKTNDGWQWISHSNLYSH